MHIEADNRTPFAVQSFVFPDAQARDTAVVVIKATFGMEQAKLSVAGEQEPVTLGDEYRGGATDSSLVRFSQAHLPKPGTDVVVLGDAWARGERAASYIDVGIDIAGATLFARVFGERYWTEGVGGVRPSAPKPLVTLPVIYEHAFGGTHAPDPDKPELLAERRNPVGRGFLGKRAARELLGQPVPNIEDPRVPLSGPSSRGNVVGFGPIAPWWAPRNDAAGTYDERWQQTRAPYLPDDFDPRFFHVAPPPLSFAHPLAGGEVVSLLGFHPQGLVRFALPHCQFTIAAQGRFSGEATPMLARLDSVIIEPPTARVIVSWRAAAPVGKRLIELERITVELAQMQGAA